MSADPFRLPPDNIVGMSEFHKQATPYTPEKVVKIFGETHSRPGAMARGIDMSTYLLDLLSQDPNAHIYTEGQGHTVDFDSNEPIHMTYDLLQLTGTPKLHSIETRNLPETYASLPEPLRTNMRRRPPIFNSQMEYNLARDFMRTRVEPIIQRYPHYEQIHRYETSPNTFATVPDAFRSGILDRNMFDIIHRNDGINPIFYVGDAHRHNVAYTLMNDPYHEFLGSGFRKINVSRHNKGI